MQNSYSRTRHFQLKTLCIKSVRFLYALVLKPKLPNEDLRRQEFIFNILSLGSIILLSILSITTFMAIVSKGASYKGVSMDFPLGMLSIFIALHILSRKGYIHVASFIFIAVYFTTNLFSVYRWGVVLPISLLIFVLLIFVSGILINSYFSLLTTIIIAVSMISLSYLQEHSIVKPNLSWRKEAVDTQDVFEYMITFCILFVISWLSNREIEKSLVRARKSESELKQERDSLEIKVEERTKELKKIQLEKMSQIYHFAEFGKLASGLFHDLVNPLTAMSLNLEQIKNLKQTSIDDAKHHLNEAFTVTKKLENFIQAIRKQIQKQEILTFFSINEEIQQTILILAYKARKEKVEIIFSASQTIYTYGNSIKFNQMIANLLSNAIDAYEQYKIGYNRKRVLIKLEKEDDLARITISDYGCGMKKENLEKIFDPFFTTKGQEKGTGIGLSTTKSIVEKDFDGKISVKSKENKGTTFIIEISIRNQPKIND